MKKSSLQTTVKKEMEDILDGYQKFHQKTQNFKKSSSKRSLPLIIKEHSRFEKVFLTQPALARVTDRATFPIDKAESFLKKKQMVSEEALSNILYLSGGLIKTTQHYRSFSPIITSQIPWEIYIISNKSEMTSGIYHYNPRTHALEILPILDQALFSKINHEMKKPSVAIIITGVFSRTIKENAEHDYLALIKSISYLTMQVIKNSYEEKITAEFLNNTNTTALDKILNLDPQSETVVEIIGLNR